MDLSLDLAMAIAKGAFDEGRTRGIAKMSVVITDTGGAIRLAMRGDGVGGFGVSIAHAKCETALGFGRSSLASSQVFTDPARVAALTAVTGGRFLPLGGGVLVADAAGELLGAAAAAGGLPEADHELIVAAVSAAGLEVPA